LGNLIGTDATGTVRTKNSYGVANNTGAVGMQIGTGNLADRNVIAGNDTGVRLHAGDLTVIQGNWIGVGPHGNIAMANDTGIIVSGGSTRTAIVGNVISGNLAEGIVLQSSSGTTILANKIGTAANGIAPLGNGYDGISFLTADAFGSVGDGTAANGNLIFANQHHGVHIASTGVSVLGNSIFSNVGLGIDLTGGIVPSNDTCDADAGPNGLQNFPVITSVTIFSDHTNISGTFESTAGNTFRVEFFQNFAGDNPGNRGGRTFIGSAPVATTLTPSCVTPFSVDLPVILSPGDLVTATATDPTGSTSLFSLATGAVVSSPGVSLSASTLDFGALLVNTVSAPLTIGLTNTGNAPLNISSITASIPFSIASQTCGATLAATASCTYDITFGPTAPGAYTGLFTLTTDAPATPTATVNLAGIGVAPPSFALVTPTGLTPGQTVPIAIQITNPPGNPASYGNFTLATLTYPVGYTNAAPGGGLPAGGCGDPSFTGGVGGGTTIGFGPGAGSVAAGTTCSIVAAQLVGPATVGSYTFTIPPGGITVSSPFVYTNPTAIIVTANVSAAPIPGITISPSSLPFPSTVVGTSSTPVSLSINNSGNAPLNISLVTATGDFTSVNGCVGPIAPTASCSITVTFTPTAAGPRSGTLTITSDAPGSPHTVPLSGTGVVLTPGVVINPPSIVFPSQNVGTSSAAQSVSVTNTGTGPLHISSVTTSGDFSNTASCPATINPGPTNACVFTVTFTPTAAGPRTGTLTVTSDATGSPHTITLSGTGAPLTPTVSLTPTSLTFAPRTVGSTSTPQTITLANTGNGPLTITSITGSGDYAFTSSCGTALAALASCTINVTFTPLAAGPRPGSLVIVDNAPGSPRTVPFSGTGAAGVTAVPMVSPGSLDFDAQAVGSSSAVQLVVVSNAGTGPLAVSSFSVTGEFAIAPPPGTTPAPCPATVVPGSACAIGVIFRPAGTNLRQGVLTIATDAGTLTVNVSGIGMVAEPPQLTMPLALDFGSRTIGITGGGLALPMHNTSPYVAAIHELTATGDFDVSDTCATIPAGDSCSLLVTFLPTQVGTRTGTLTVRTMRDANPYVVSLTGVGIENVLPALQASPIRVGFGNVFVGGNSSQTVTLRNAGRGPLHVSGILFTGDYSAGPSCVGTIQPGASCAVNITFSPMIPGGRQGVMQILSDDPNGTLDVSLSGAGCYLPTPSHARAGLPLCGS
jgi:parallel beta-helix repeat protein